MKNNIPVRNIFRPDILEIKKILRRKNNKLRLFQISLAVSGSSRAAGSISKEFTGG